MRCAQTASAPRAWRCHLPKRPCVHLAQSHSRRPKSSFANSRRGVTSAPRPRVLVTRSLKGLGSAQERLKESMDLLLWDSDEVIPRSSMLDMIRGVDGLICMLTDRVDEEILATAGPNLRVVSTMSVGHDHIDLAACEERGVRVGNTPGVLTGPTADIAVGLTLMSARRLEEGVHAVHNGEWSSWKPRWLCSPFDVSGCTVGIVGLGRIGAAYGQRMKGFGCKLLYTGLRERRDHAEPLGATYVPELKEMLGQCDVVSLHCALTPFTRHLINKETLAAMRAHAVLVNTARGDVVNQDDLADALRSGTIGAAGLDVTTPEPLSPSHELVKLPNTCVLPHLGSATIPTRTEMADMALRNLVAGIAGKQLPFHVNT